MLAVPRLQQLKVPVLASLIARQSDDEIELTNGITIEIQTASFRAIRGFTVIAFLADEMSFWRNEESAADPDAEILIASRAATATLRGNAKLLTAGSSYARRGEQWRAYRRYHGRDDAPVLVWQASTRTMNSSVPEEFIREQLERDPEANAAEYLAQFRSDLADYIPREVVEVAAFPGRFELPPVPGVQYIGAIDISGGSSDSMALAIAHAGPNGSAVLDAVREARPPFAAEIEVTAQADLCRTYNVTRIVGDRYGGLWPVEAFARHGVTYEAADRVKSDYYRDLLPLLTSAKIELLDNTRLVNQPVSLERRTSRAGKDSIDHPPGQHDDVINAAAIALVLASTTAAPSLWRGSDLLGTDGAREPWPRLADLVFASLAADERGLAVLYWAANRNFDGPTLLLIDFDLRPFTPGLFPAIRDRLHAEAKAAHAAIRVFTTTALAAQIRAFSDDQALAFVQAGDLVAARAAELPVEAVADGLLADREALLLAAATAIGGGKVRIAAPTHERSRQLPLPVPDLRPGVAPSAVIDSALIGIGVSVDLRALPKATTAQRRRHDGLSAAR